MYKVTFYVTLQGERIEIGDIISKEQAALKALEEGKEKATIIVNVLKPQFKWLRAGDVEIHVHPHDPQLQLFPDMPAKTPTDWSHLRYPEEPPTLKTLHTATAPREEDALVWYSNPKHFSPEMEEFIRTRPDVPNGGTALVPYVPPTCTVPYMAQTLQ